MFPGISVTGIEVDGAWWHCKYAPPTFIPLIVTSPQLNEDVLLELGNKDNAILFCYFNNRSAFENYLKHFCGPVLVIIGPDQGKGVYTEPGPFEKILGWELYKWREVRQSKDFLSVYFRRVEVDSWWSNQTRDILDILTAVIQMYQQNDAIKPHLFFI